MDSTISKEDIIKKISQKEKQINELSSDVEALRRVLSIYHSATENEMATNETTQQIYESKKPMLSENMIGSEFDRNWKQEDQVLWILKKIKSGFAHEVGAELHSLDQSVPLDRANAAASLYLSKLNKAGKITYEKYGKKFKYHSI